jgi:predicted HTH domain antitoxin
VKVPDDLEDELEAYLDDENLDRSTAVRKLLAVGLADWRRERALDELAAGNTSFTRAADIAGVSVREFAQLANERDITWRSRSRCDPDLEDPCSGCSPQRHS